MPSPGYTYHMLYNNSDKLVTFEELGFSGGKKLVKVGDIGSLTGYSLNITNVDLSDTNRLLREKDLIKSIDRIFIDDYPDNILSEILIEFGVNSLQQYVNKITSTSPPTLPSGINEYYYTNQSMQFNGETYNIWKYIDNPNMYGLMSQELYYKNFKTMSMHYDINNRECPFYLVNVDSEYWPADGNSFSLVYYY